MSRIGGWAALVVLGAGSFACDASRPIEGSAPTIRAELAPGITGVANAPLAETDQRPLWSLATSDGPLGIEAYDVALDRDTGQLVWIDASSILWVAPLAAAPNQERRVDEDVIAGLATSRGRVAYAVRIDGPETAPFVADLSTLERTALADAPGPDEVLAFSADGREVLLLSGRTGLASLFAAAVDAPTVRQLTNVGLTPGPTLDTSTVIPPPVDARSVSWERGRLVYDSGTGPVTLEVAR